jgi:energy-coupling factor transporter ATP-binding protein EcfA2
MSCNSLSGINLIIGENGSGKTFLLKALYSAIRTTEEYKRGDDIRNANDILAEKIRWIFQTDKLGDIVTKGNASPYTFKMSINGQDMEYQFSKDATAKIVTLSNSISRTEYNSVFIPAKEVLSLYSIILKSREIDHSFGFDDTYYDLTNPAEFLIRAKGCPPVHPLFHFQALASLSEDTTDTRIHSERYFTILVQLFTGTGRLRGYVSKTVTILCIAKRTDWFLPQFYHIPQTEQ